jgi:hypothetical protein
MLNGPSDLPRLSRNSIWQTEIHLSLFDVISVQFFYFLLLQRPIVAAFSLKCQRPIEFEKSTIRKTLPPVTNRKSS